MFDAKQRDRINISLKRRQPVARGSSKPAGIAFVVVAGTTLVEWRFAQRATAAGTYKGTVRYIGSSGLAVTHSLRLQAHLSKHLASLVLSGSARGVRDVGM
jgi:hypothetical protein